MIPGFNTDIEHDGTVYHVQTEDKGLPARMIMSLVYDGGTILASKRVTYEDLTKGTLDEAEVADRVQRQHKLICAAVKAGRIGELKGMSQKGTAIKTAPDDAVVQEAVSATAAEAGATEVVRDHEASPATPVSPPVSKTPVSSPPVQVKAEALPAAAALASTQAVPLARATTKLPPSTQKPVAVAEPVIEAVEIIDEIVLPADAVVVVTESSSKERATHEKLTVQLLGESTFKSGDRKTVGIMISRGTQRQVISGAQIMVKVLGSTFRPVIFHARSDVNGIARIHLQVPQFKAGRAALLVRVLAEGEEVELRRPVTVF